MGRARLAADSSGPVKIQPTMEEFPRHGSGRGRRAVVQHRPTLLAFRGRAIGAEDQRDGVWRNGDWARCAAGELIGGKKMGEVEK